MFKEHRNNYGSEYNILIFPFPFLIYLQRSLSRLWSLRSHPRRKRSEGKHEVTSQVHTKHMQMIVKRVTCNNYQVQSFFLRYINGLSLKTSSGYHLLG